MSVGAVWCMRVYSCAVSVRQVIGRFKRLVHAIAHTHTDTLPKTMVCARALAIKRDKANNVQYLTMYVPYATCVRILFVIAVYLCLRSLQRYTRAAEWIPTHECVCVYSNVSKRIRHVGTSNHLLPNVRCTYPYKLYCIYYYYVFLVAYSVFTSLCRHRFGFFFALTVFYYHRCCCRCWHCIANASALDRVLFHRLAGCRSAYARHACLCVRCERTTAVACTKKGAYIKHCRTRQN